MIFLLDLVLEILVVGFICLGVTSLILQFTSLLDREIQSLVCIPTLLNLGILVASLAGRNLICGKGRQL